MYRKFKRKAFIWLIIFCNNINGFTVISDQFNAKYENLTEPKLVSLKQHE